MATDMPILPLALHIATVLVLSPLLPGVIQRVKARAAGRRGAPLLQPWYDLVRLARKGSVISRTTTWVFRAGPVVGLATSALAALLVPLGHPGAPLAFAGDLVLLAYLFGLGRFFTIAAALDTGSAFEGMGAAREATFSCLAEPALFLGLMTTVKLTGTLSLSQMLGAPGAVVWASAGSPLILVAVSFFIVMLAENARIPFDDPDTHLELTMVHEVMVLDHSGPALAMIQYGAALKLMVSCALVVRLILPFGAVPDALEWPVFAGAMLLLAAGIGVVESTAARLRLVHVPRLLVSACLLSGFGLLLVAR